MTGPSDTPLTARDVPSALMRQTLLDRDLVRPVEARPVIRLLPWLDVVVIGGRSIMDRGRDSAKPREISSRSPQHQHLAHGPTDSTRSNDRTG